MSQDFRDLLAECNAENVEFLVVGAQALAAYGCVRATKDLDVWVRPEADNAKRTISALRKFGTPLHDLTEAGMATPGVTFQVGRPPLRIDVLTEITGVRFEAAWTSRTSSTFGDQPIHPNTALVDSPFFIGGHSHTAGVVMYSLAYHMRDIATAKASETWNIGDALSVHDTYSTESIRSKSPGAS